MAGAFAPAIFSCPPDGQMTLWLKSLNSRDSACVLIFYPSETAIYLTSPDCPRAFAVKGHYFIFLARTALLFAPTHP
jgi:hypothetical protein